MNEKPVTRLDAIVQFSKEALALDCGSQDAAEEAEERNFWKESQLLLVPK